MNTRECNQCRKMVDFDEPWCDHETMEESARLNIPRGIKQAYVEKLYKEAENKVIDDLVNQAAVELGWSAGQALSDKIKRDLE